MDLTVARPPAWIDRSMIVVSAPKPPPSGMAPNVVVTQEAYDEEMMALAPPARFAEFVRRQTAQMEAKLPGMRSLAHEEGRRGERATAQVLVAWDSPQARLSQWVRFIERPPERVVIATATCAEGEFDQFQAELARTLYSIDFPA